ncbi:hypothetical protein QBC40DRAFT_348617 [Triangularia verruculosa]|uniref:Uncharacterized protein n=1 Tax=Triangularia verruculosa TaxID=2587418 RepID=A0AAN6XJJ1_9PEZI|nr:hypothetical protein QBC40DRAFT_348617 [Triangularia verruculosa]
MSTTRTSLPAELLQRIVYFSDANTRGNLLTVSRDLQVFVEEATWPREITINSDDDLEVLRARYITRHRARLLRHVLVNFDFPVLRDTEEEPLRCRETAEEGHANDVLFTRRIKGVFEALKRIEEGLGDGGDDLRITLEISQPTQGDNNLQFCDHRRYHSWRLKLLLPEELPMIRCVRRLVVGVTVENSRGLYASDDCCRYQRPVELSVVVALLVKMPRCEAIECQDRHERLPYAFDGAPVLDHFTRPWEGPRRDSRHGFGKAVFGRLGMFEGLREVKMRLPGRYTCCDQRRALPDLVVPNFDYDPVSSALRVMSQGAERFDVCLYGDSTVFWPPTISPDGSQSLKTAMLMPDCDPAVDGSPLPIWPRLKKLSVELMTATPTGTWYFQGVGDGAGGREVGYRITKDHYPPLGDNEADEHWDEVWDEEGGRYENVAPNVFRIVPIDDAVEGVLEAFAKALGRMPVVEDAELFFMLRWDPGEEEGGRVDRGEVERYMPACLRGSSRRPPREQWLWGVGYSTLPGGSRRLDWRVGSWRPSERILNLFREATGDAEEQWLD